MGMDHLRMMGWPGSVVLDCKAQEGMKSHGVVSWNLPPDRLLFSENWPGIKSGFSWLGARTGWGAQGSGQASKWQFLRGNQKSGLGMKC